MSKTGTAITYDYGADGYRISKAVTEGGTTTTYQYFYSGGKLIHVSWNDSDRVHIFYNAGGSPISILYDAWGKPLTTTGSMAGTLGKVNLLRYRGYVYDEETGLYYLGSRYYDPAVGRFINADEYVTTEQGLCGYCLFAYCGNNPVSKFDSGGKWTKGISFSFNITAFVGLSYSIGFFGDDNGNTEWQSSYCNQFDDGETMGYGFMDAGIGITFQWTEADTIYDLYGPSLVIGGSGGNNIYAGLDMVYLGEFDVHDHKK